jgi:hypothetical protein
MNDAQMEPIDRFHDELKALESSGTGANVGLDWSQGSHASQLDRIRYALAVRVNLGQGLVEALRQDVSLPLRYRAAALAWVQLDSPAAVLDAISAAPLDDGGDEVDHNIRLSFFQAALTLALLCVGLAIYTAWFSPKLQSLYTQLQLTPPASVRWLSSTQIWLPVQLGLAAAAVLALLMMGFGPAGRWAADRWTRTFPAIRKREALRHYARFADQLAIWLQHGLPLDEGVQLAAALNLEPAMSFEPPRWPMPADDARRLEIILPPLLAWAVQTEAADDARPATLQRVSDIYQDLAQRQVAPWMSSVPVIVAALVCGFAVLIYGVALFLPLSTLLQDVSAPGRY